MARISDKINLPTNTTDIRTLALYLKAIETKGIVKRSEEDAIFAQVKIDASRKKVTAPKKDTHTRQTLLSFGLIEINSDYSLQVSELGMELLGYYDNESSWTEEDRIALMLKIFFRFEVIDEKRKIHPGFIITKLMCDADMDYKITNHELAEFVMEPTFVSDNQYDLIKQHIINFRKSKKGISQYVAQTKATTFLTTFVNNWKIFTSDKQELTSQQNKRGDELFLKETLNGATSELANISESQNNAKRDFHSINVFRLNGMTSYIAHLYLSLLSGVKVKDYLSYFSVQPPAAAEKTNSYDIFLRALRTKPFLLLAGISGTGKSRIVRELAFKSCPENLRDSDGTTPGNYCMIEVKPNWHDSTELLGYYSNISGLYQFTKFIKFLVKAMMYPKIPFFVCLDEMNLAPVEQYFAEFLSVLETRKIVGDNIQSGVLVPAEYFKNVIKEQLIEYGGEPCKNNGEVYSKMYNCSSQNINLEEYTNKSLLEKGLTLPDNVFVVGTVNMDDTTHQFSRKVIDRAMTIEMNGGELKNMFGRSSDLEYLPDEDVWPLNKFTSKYVSADEALTAHLNEAETMKEKLVERLDVINTVLSNTPFQISFRVLNELCIYTAVLLDDKVDIDEAISTAVDQITLMKILPRIEGDEDMFAIKNNPDKNMLDELIECLSDCPESCKKLTEMNERLKNSSGFTRFWP